MTRTQFCYWLQGYFEISGSTELSVEQYQIIRNHINLVNEVENLEKPATVSTDSDNIDVDLTTYENYLVESFSQAQKPSTVLPSGHSVMRC